MIGTDRVIVRVGDETVEESKVQARPSMEWSPAFLVDDMILIMAHLASDGLIR